MLSYQDAVAQLKLLQVDALAHRGDGNLLDHLQGTYALLKKWDNPESICLAGLFHSIYGTQTFTTSSMDISARKQVADIISPMAEILAYRFCIQDQWYFLANLKTQLQAASGHHIRNRFTKEKIDLTPVEFMQLMELFVANELEQIPHMTSWRVWHFRWVKLYIVKLIKHRGQQWLSPQCYQDVLTCVRHPNRQLVEGNQQVPV